METFYTDPDGFLGTGASLLADLTLIAYIFLIVPAMIAGFVFARRGHYRPHHKWTMVTITGINWFLIIFLMFGAVTYDIAEKLPDQPDNARYLTPAIHMLFGVPGQLLATYIVYRMLREDYQVNRAKARGETNMEQYWFTSAKPFMRATLGLWLLAATFGIFSYLVRYEVVDVATDSGTPAATEEVVPLETEAPDQTQTPQSPDATEEALPTLEITIPAETETPELDDSSMRTREPDDD